MTCTARPGPREIWLAYDEASNRGDHDAAAAFVAPDLAVLVNGVPALSSVAEDRAVQTELIRCYPDYARSFVGALEDGDSAAIEWRMHGTPAPGVDLPPLDVPGCSVVRCRDGRIVEARLYHPTGALDRVADRALGRD
ncbi:nuclear transport factor 2 family protein [Blastococcus mobilis]|uniref:Ketosteroid isomerase-related protein n=1 Tax=Blastococcus mobilis TaxID=1938746 RepID=A0A239A7J1_9ACTN|nr:nuclear transport factor 2 family protein [Blastococcus mobilis]SNR91605.1 Ketosteroid isomerase-related protein [Blastococcus mobilis]